ncbi:MAG: hypothetical protein ACHQ49_07320 [Elusimicrobiota bacterium]
MKRTSLLLAFSVAACAGLADAQVQWDSAQRGASSVGDLVRAQSAPSTPASTTVASAEPASVDRCTDAAALAGRDMELTVNIPGKDKPLVLGLAFERCSVESARQSPQVPPYAYRVYKSAWGDILGINTDEGQPRSDIRLDLVDGGYLWGDKPTASTKDLASGRTIDLGTATLVVPARGGRDAYRVKADISIKSIPAR